jgi:hypothetical protein
MANILFNFIPFLLDGPVNYARLARVTVPLIKLISGGGGVRRRRSLICELHDLVIGGLRQASDCVG